MFKKSKLSDDQTVISLKNHTQCLVLEGLSERVIDNILRYINLAYLLEPPKKETIIKLSKTTNATIFSKFKIGDLVAPNTSPESLLGSVAKINIENSKYKSLGISYDIKGFNGIFEIKENRLTKYTGDLEFLKIKTI